MLKEEEQAEQMPTWSRDYVNRTSAGQASDDETGREKYIEPTMLRETREAEKEEELPCAARSQSLAPNAQRDSSRSAHEKGKRRPIPVECHLRKKYRNIRDEVHVGPSSSRSVVRSAPRHRGHLDCSAQEAHIITASPRDQQMPSSVKTFVQ